MAEKNFNARFKQKHDIEANWAKASFVPLAGEFIVYDTDENNPLPRIKVGDGETQINNLPFVDKGKMTYKGEVSELPTSVNEGDVYKITNDVTIGELHNKYKIIENGSWNFNNDRNYGYHLDGYGFMYLFTYNDRDLEEFMWNLLGYEYGEGTITFNAPIVIHFLLDNTTEYTLTATSMSYIVDESGGLYYHPHYIYGTFSPAINEGEGISFADYTDVKIWVEDPSISLDLSNYSNIAEQFTVDKTVYAGSSVIYTDSWQVFTESTKGFVNEAYVDEKLAEKAEKEHIHHYDEIYIPEYEPTGDENDYPNTLQYELIYKANIHLTNVVDETFKSKGIESGLGTMNYKGEVNILPETAKEGDIYEGSQQITQWTKLGDYVNDCGLYLYSSGFDMEGDNVWNSNLANDIYYGTFDGDIEYKFVISGVEYVYTDCYINGASEYYVSILGTTSDVTNTIHVDDGASVVIYKMETVIGDKKLYIYHNNEWVEHGVTQSYVDTAIDELDVTIDELETIKANTDLSNVDNNTFKAKAEESGIGVGGGIPIVTATSSNGTSYTATVDGVTSLDVGTRITIIPNRNSASTSPTLNINSLGDYAIQMPVAYNSYSTSVGATATWLVADTPITLMYNGEYWITVDMPRASAQYLQGTVPVSSGGTGKSSWNTNGLIYPSGSTTLTQLAIPTEESILMQKSNNAPYWIAKNTLAESDLSNIDNTVFKNKIQECGFEAGANNGGGFKKIGFTSDCDYVATSTDGLTAFTNAIAAAADGDTILVMPGTYISSNTLTIAKNINFVGVSMPTIGFAITISGDASAVYRTNWEGIKFTRAISALGYTDENDSYSGGGSTFNTINCIFRNITNNLFIGGTHNNSNFENIKNIWSDGTSTEVIFYNCNFVECKTFTNPYAGDITFNYCNIHNQSNSFLFDADGYGGHYLSNTNIYNYNSSSSFNVGSITIQLDGCSIFGILPLNCSIDNGGITLTNTYHYAGSIPGDASTAPVTQSSMETYVDDTINRTTSVDEADTNYSTYMARGTSLNSTETTPTANGTVAWTYE